MLFRRKKTGKIFSFFLQFLGILGKCYARNSFLYLLDHIYEKKISDVSSPLKDVKYLSAEQDLDTPAIEHTSTLKMYLIKNFEENIAFFPSGKYLVVHPIDINPCTYSVATLRGCGLRDGELTKAFGRMIRRKFEERKTSEDTWPLTELLSKLDSGPLPELYNAIYFSIYERRKINQYGYAETSDVKASKIWSLASDWESMITKQRTPQQIILGLVLHRITGKSVC